MSRWLAHLMRCEVFALSLRLRQLVLARAAQFVMHSAQQFEPRIMVLLAPPKTVTPLGYRVVFENNTLTADRVFFVPGLKEASWNKACRVLVA